MTVRHCVANSFLENQYDQAFCKRYCTVLNIIFPVGAILWLLSFVFQKGLDVVNPKKKQKKKGYVNSGVLYVSQCNVCG